MKRHTSAGTWNSNLEWRPGEIPATYVNSTTLSLVGNWLATSTSYGILPTGVAVRVRVRDNSNNEITVNYGWVDTLTVVGGNTQFVLIGFPPFNNTNKYIISFSRGVINNSNLSKSHINIHVNNTFVEKGVGGEVCWNTDAQNKMEFYDTNNGSVPGGFSFYTGNSGIYTKVAGIDGTTGAYTAFSDAKFKTHLKEITKEQGLEFTREVTPYTFVFRNKYSDLGFIAQDVEKQQPLLVTEDVEAMTGETGLALSYMKICVMQQAAIRALLSKVEELEVRLDKLEAKT